MDTFYAEREKKIKEERVKKLKKEEYVNECIKKLEVEQDKKKEEFLKKEKKRNLILKSIDMEKTKRTLNATKKNMDKYMLTEAESDIKLPLSEKIKNKNWKVRKNALDELSEKINLKKRI